MFHLKVYQVLLTFTRLVCLFQYSSRLNNHLHTGSGNNILHVGPELVSLSTLIPLQVAFSFIWLVPLGLQSHYCHYSFAWLHTILFVIAGAKSNRIYLCLLISRRHCNFMIGIVRILVIAFGLFCIESLWWCNGYLQHNTFMYACLLLLFLPSW